MLIIRAAVLAVLSLVAEQCISKATNRLPLFENAFAIFVCGCVFLMIISITKK